MFPCYIMSLHVYTKNNSFNGGMQKSSICLFNQYHLELFCFHSTVFLLDMESVFEDEGERVVSASLINRTQNLFAFIPQTFCRSQDIELESCNVRSLLSAFRHFLFVTSKTFVTVSMIHVLYFTVKAVLLFSVCKIEIKTSILV